MSNNYIVEHREDIITKLQDNVFVEAGAGAGKTSIIVDRITNQLQSGYAPSSIVAITFTNKAAEELRKRITEEVEKKVALGYLDDSVLDELDQMNISTIHSFCNTIIEEKSFDSLVPVGTKLMEADELKKSALEYLEHWFLKNMSLDEWEAIPLKEEKGINSAKLIVQELFVQYLTSGEDAQIVVPDVGEDDVKNQLDNVIKDFAELFEVQKREYKLIVGDVIYHDGDDGRAKRMETYISAIDQDRSNYSLEDYLEKLKPLLTSTPASESSIPTTKDPWFEVINTVPDTKQDDIKEINEYCRSEYDYISKKYKDGLKKQAEWILKGRQYVACSSIAIRALQDYKRDRKSDELSQDLLIKKTQELLQKQSVREYYSKKYRCIYVDEFQDTEHMQKDFIWNLAAVPDDTTKLRDGALFVVGDPKQSIYRFRGAEPEVFFETRETMEKLPNAKRYVLTKNFRSNQMIIEGFVNPFFGSMKLVDYVDSEGNSEEYVDMDSFNKIKDVPSDSKQLAGFYRVQDLYTNANDESKITSKEEDAEELAKLIQFLLDRDNGFKIANPSTEKDENDQTIVVDNIRPIRASDILVLCEKTPHMQAYINKLQEYQIPVTVKGKLSVVMDLSIRTYVDILKALLKGPFNAMYMMCGIEALKKVYGYKTEEYNKICQEILIAMCKATEKMSAFGKANYLARHIEHYIIRKPEYSERPLLDRGTLLTVEARIQQLLETLEQTTYESSGSLIDALEQYIDSKHTIDKELAIDEEQDAVSFMNLHQAKGLEGNIVIWANRRDSADIKTTYRKHNKEEGFTEVYPTFKREGSRYPEWVSYEYCDDIKDAASKGDREEQLRLEYVAATRAKQAFILMRLFADDKGKYVEDLFANSKDYKTEVWPFDLQTFKDYDPTVKFKEKEKSVKLFTPNNFAKEGVVKEYNLDGTLDVETEKHVSPSSLEEKYTTKYHAIGLMKKDDSGNADEEEETDELQITGNRPKSNVVGNILHRSFELAVRKRINCKKALDAKAIEICVNRAVYENSEDIFGAENEKLIKEYILCALTCGMKTYEEKEYLDNVLEVNTEMQFSFYDDKSEDVPKYINGFMDLLLIKNDGTALIIDYKSDEADSFTDHKTNQNIVIPEDIMVEALKKKYTPQLNLYKHATEKLYPKHVVSAKIMYFREYDGSQVKAKFADII